MKGSVKAHISLLLAASMWGLMSPVGKAAMEAGITGLTLANMRMIGAAVCFWTTSFFVKQEKVNPHDLLMLFFAVLVGWHPITPPLPRRFSPDSTSCLPGLLRSCSPWLSVPRSTGRSSCTPDPGRCPVPLPARLP